MFNFSFFDSFFFIALRNYIQSAYDTIDAFFFYYFVYFFGYWQARWRDGRDCPYSRDYYFEHTDSCLWDPLGFNHHTWHQWEYYEYLCYDTPEGGYFDWFWPQWKLVLDLDHYGNTNGLYVLFYFFIFVLVVLFFHRILYYFSRRKVYGEYRVYSHGFFILLMSAALMHFPYFLTPYDVVNFLTTDEVQYTLKVGRYMHPEYWRTAEDRFMFLYQSVLLPDEHWEHVKKDWNPLRWIRINVGTEDIFTAGYGDWLENNHPDEEFFLKRYVENTGHKESLFNHSYERHYTPVDPRSVWYKKHFTADPRFPDPEPGMVVKWTYRFERELVFNWRQFYWEELCLRKHDEWLTYACNPNNSFENITNRTFGERLWQMILHPNHINLELLFRTPGLTGWYEEVYRRDIGENYYMYDFAPVLNHYKSDFHAAVGTGFYTTDLQDHRTRPYYPSKDFKDALPVPFYNFDYTKDHHDPTYGWGKRFEYSDSYDLAGVPITHPLSAPMTKDEARWAAHKNAEADGLVIQVDRIYKGLRTELVAYKAKVDSNEIDRDLAFENRIRDRIEDCEKILHRSFDMKAEIHELLEKNRATRSAPYNYYDNLIKERGLERKLPTP